MATYQAKYSHRTYKQNETKDILDNEILISENKDTIYVGTGDTESPIKDILEPINAAINGLQDTTNSPYATKESLTNYVTTEDLETIEVGTEQIEALQAISSQGRASKYIISQGTGWYRILNLIRASNGTVTIGFGQNNRNNSGRGTQTLAFDFGAYVWYPGPNDGSIEPDDGKPIFKLKYNNLFGDDRTDSCFTKVTKVRLGYPDINDPSWPPEVHGGGAKITGFDNPINCYLDIYIEMPDILIGVSDPTQININYTGFSNSHETALITEQMKIEDTNLYGVQGEVLKFREIPLDKMETYSTPENTASNTVKVNFTKTLTCGEEIVNNNIISLNPDNNFERVPRYNLLVRKGTPASETGYIEIDYKPEGYYVINTPKSGWNPIFYTNNTVENNNLLNWFTPPINLCTKYKNLDTAISPIILNEGEYFISEGTGLLIKNGENVTYGPRVRVNRTDSNTFTILPNESLTVVGMRLVLNAPKDISNKIITPMLIKKEGIFSDLTSIEYVMENNQLKEIVFKGKSKNEGDKAPTIYSCPPYKMKPDNYDNLIDSTKRMPGDTLQYKIPLINGELPVDMLQYYGVDGGKNDFSEAPTATVKYQKELQNLPVIVSDDQPDPDQAILWIKPSDIT